MDSEENSSGSPKDEKWYFKKPIFEFLEKRVYHERIFHGPWQVNKMRLDFASNVLRSRFLVPYGKNGGELVLKFGEELFCHAYESIITFYAADPEAAMKQGAFLSDHYKMRSSIREPQFYILELSDFSPNTHSVTLTQSFAMSKEELALHYGPDAPDFEAALRQAFKSRRSGLTLFRGEPGTGKTSFIRHLIARLQGRCKFYFIPAEGYTYLTSAAMVGFWAQEHCASPKTQKVVVIEDAEQLLAARDPGNRNSVSALLNVADGLLGEFLQIHLLCTINCSLDKLDPAIIRSGRMLTCREFGRLSREQAEVLAAQKNIQIPVQSNYSLAEIYNGKGVAESLSPASSIGFRT